MICSFFTFSVNIERHSEVFSNIQNPKIQNQIMGKPIKIFEQRNDETNAIENFHMKNNIGWWEERQRGRWYCGPKRSLYGNKSSTQEQSIRNIVKQYKLFSMFQKAAILIYQIFEPLL